MKDYNAIYQRVNKFLLKKEYNPIIIGNNRNNIEVVLFADYTKKIVFAVSLKKMSDILYLLEGALFYNISQKSISCAEWRTCSISCNNINIDSLISQFESGFEQFMLDGDEFIINDNNVEFSEMRSGIIFEDPDDAICKYTKQTNQQAFIWNVQEHKWHSSCMSSESNNDYISQNE